MMKVMSIYGSEVKHQEILRVLLYNVLKRLMEMNTKGTSLRQIYTQGIREDNYMASG